MDKMPGLEASCFVELEWMANYFQSLLTDFKATSFEVTYRCSFGLYYFSVPLHAFPGLLHDAPALLVSSAKKRSVRRNKKLLNYSWEELKTYFLD